MSFSNRDVVDLRMNLRDRPSRSQRSSPVSSSSSNSGGGGGNSSGSGGGGSSHFRTLHCRSPFSLASSCSVTSTGGLKSPAKASRGQRQSKRSNSAFEVNIKLLSSSTVSCPVPKLSFFSHFWLCLLF